MVLLMNYFIRYSTFREFWIKESFVSSATTNTCDSYLCATSYTLFTQCSNIVKEEKEHSFKKIFNLTEIKFSISLQNFIQM